MEFRRRRLLAVPVLALGLAGMTGSPAAAADAGVVVVTGTGTVSPGLTAIPTPQSYTFTGVQITATGTLNGQTYVNAPSSCNSSGPAGLPQNYAAGTGVGTYQCTTGPLIGSGSITFVRVGSYVEVVVTGVLQGTLQCLFTADQLPPAAVTSYKLDCVGEGGKV